MNERLERRENRMSGYIASLILGGALLWVMNALPSWRVPFLLDSYSRTLPAINLSLWVQIAMNIVLIFYHPRFFHHLGQVVIAGFSIFAIATIAAVFPLDFSSIVLPATAPTLNLIARLALYIAMGGTAIGAIVHFFKFLGRIFRGEIEA